MNSDRIESDHSISEPSKHKINDSTHDSRSLTHVLTNNNAILPIARYNLNQARITKKKVNGMNMRTRK